MHVTALRKELVDAHPWLPFNLYRAFNEAKAIGMKRMINPRIAPLAWYQAAWEEQQRVLGPDPWQYGLTPKNRTNLETLIGYSHEQGLIKTRFTPDDLFVPVELAGKRGEEFRI
jgi:4,5-dihydroxyphthalate decarboxylase